ncbi:PrsW family intramembrane metalloprotease [Propionicimonas sp.]|uniref:PrsW family intramembrane metalloprotease n=1 Tax=Propionicimonas sp. TaxID=1955623 RepID=UPI00182CA5A1|nr:PrsW family intramembrane metalloprotease [Propionicimonas sp.]MBU3977841.1 PrsW family intramembrane metalloprotease [Actinomycetota bacterium]MBA3021935.1 PrsW family intramembrane metalloprotease [Propionicimonas sp.]MBU3987618.1 PrsW family intramembrane metalloprotease [Actinomycetota bacterium]MBU4007340.1 PrsW family intramembrane metalloprotease [Actinomycetota bacterium]MBU4065714.1 PrsW family intramembrane metalloprotease [Actinomycetota bacterium]
MTDSVAELARRRNAIPSEPEPVAELPQRILRSGWTWLLLGMTILYAAAATWLLTDIASSLKIDADTTGLNVSAMRQSAWLALPTVVFWTVVFLLADRYRPQRFVIWFLTLGWGGAIAVIFSYYINTWAADHLAIGGNGNPASSARVAIFVAPFVEEAAKASVIFLIAIFARYRLTSKVSTMVLAGLSAAGFAFTENILYYARVIIFASTSIEAGDAEAALNEVVWLRGFWTAFGHPLFTMMTGIGIAVALRTHSKVVRILAPLIGYLAASFLHMFYNSQATFAQGTMQLIMYFGVAVPMVLSAVVYVVRQILLEGRRIRSRLVDYTQLGWLPETDPLVMAKLRLRLWALMVAITRGLKPFLATVRLQRALTELAYLRDGEVRGLYDRAAIARERQLVELARELRRTAISDPRGMKLDLPRWRRAKPVSFGLPNYPGPAGIGGNWPAPVTTPQVGSGHSAVDPNWGPPRG